MVDGDTRTGDAGLALGMVMVRPVRDTQAEAFSQELIAGIDEAMSSAGGSFLVKIVGDEESELETYRHWAATARIGSVIIEDLTVTDGRLALLGELGLDVVVSGDLDLAGDRPAIWTDHSRAMRLAVLALHDLGHRRIARVSGPTQFRHSLARSAAFVEVTKELGIRPLEAIGDYSRQSGAAATRELLDREHPPTAIIFDNDLMAVGGLAHATESGCAVPGDLSIVAWDDSVRCQISDPPLAALSHDVRQIGEMLGAAVVEAQRGRTVRDETPPPTLVLRGSVTAPRPTDD
ncbi:LacI family DNA-binding transcriptional regulator [Herbiconiux sp. A18JL235]|uniref:LacI family DNA-binding transcriptional regulator n=1 Tax=Herbiconiux sp. A18JL235 TaxID=3152363 RepID=A0AB39BFZ2_9MICO